MLLKPRSAKRQDAAPLPEGMIQFPASVTMRSAIAQIAAKWGVSVEESARRITIMALSGWKLKFAGHLTQLSRFCCDQEDTFQSTCITVRNWLNLHERGMEEELSDEDIVTRLEFILDALQEKRKHGERADLNEILVEDDDSADMVV